MRHGFLTFLVAAGVDRRAVGDVQSRGGSKEGNATDGDKSEEGGGEVQRRHHVRWHRPGLRRRLQDVIGAVGREDRG